jgi:hypothetical protein
MEFDKITPLEHQNSPNFVRWQFKPKEQLSFYEEIQIPNGFWITLLGSELGLNLLGLQTFGENCG